jgi:LAO/AO transport system kinase
VDDLIATLDDARAGDRRALARLLSIVESGDAALRRELATYVSASNHARVIGMTGPPGAGKSSLIGALLPVLRTQERRVAVLAVDPSSPLTGGALLGDRVRFASAAHDDGVYVRSMATRGHLGGCAVATPQATQVLDAVGFDDIIVETAGVGQSEVDVVAVADVTVVVLAPGFGDHLQAEKAGILEVADVLVVNKADLAGADALDADLRWVSNGVTGDGDTPRDAVHLLRTVATGVPQGLDALVAAIDHVTASETARADRRLQRMAALITELALTETRRQLTADPAQLAAFADDVLAGRRDLYGAADALRRVHQE